MLRFLRIRNLAVIESVEVEFEPGFNVLTGETGAGKSIVVEAVGLLLGGRSSPDLVRTGETQASIEAIFEDGGAGGRGPSRHHEPGPKPLLRQRGSGDIVRRSAICRSAWSSCTASTSIRRCSTQLRTCRCWTSTPAWRIPRRRWAPPGRRCAELREQLDRARHGCAGARARGWISSPSSSAEIERVSPKPQEDEELAAARQVLASAERIQRLCDESYSALYDRDDAALSLLGGVWKRVGELAAIEPQFASYVTGAARHQVPARGSRVLPARTIAETIDASPARLQEVDDRLALARAV